MVIIIAFPCGFSEQNTSCILRRQRNKIRQWSALNLGFLVSEAPDWNTSVAAIAQFKPTTNIPVTSVTKIRSCDSSQNATTSFPARFDTSAWTGTAPAENFRAISPSTTLADLWFYKKTLLWYNHDDILNVTSTATCRTTAAASKVLLLSLLTFSINFFVSPEIIEAVAQLTHRYTC